MRPSGGSAIRLVRPLGKLRAGSAHHESQIGNALTGRAANASQWGEVQFLVGPSTGSGQVVMPPKP